jgi:hypothetical protein
VFERDVRMLRAFATPLWTVSGKKSAVHGTYLDEVQPGVQEGRKISGHFVRVEKLGRSTLDYG